MSPLTFLRAIPQRSTTPTHFRALLPTNTLSSPLHRKDLVKYGNSMLGHEFGDGVRTGIGVLSHKVALPLKDIWFQGFEVEILEGFKESWVIEFSNLVLVD